MLRPTAVTLLSFLAAVLVGCGGDGNASPAGAGEFDPARLLVGVHDFPRGAEAVEPPPELCGPLPFLEQDGSRTAASQVYFVKKTRIAEAVGIFAAPAPAASAYRGLNDPRRIACIRDAIGSFSSAASVEILRPRPLGIGDEALLVRYLSIDDDSQPQGYTDVVSVRVGRCTASLIVAAARGGLPGAFSRQMRERVAELLGEPCRR